jgi:hypothetical protein
MPEITCYSCFGNREVTCTKCNGQGSYWRPGAGKVVWEPCAVCGGKRRVPCQTCHGTGHITVSGPLSAPTGRTGPTSGPSPTLSPPALNGRWKATSGGTYEFATENDGYHVTQRSILGKVGEGRATVNGNVVTLTIKSVLLVTLTVDLRLNGDKLEGLMPVLGMSVPFVLYRA